jgi:hypothetical protein
VDNPGSSYLPPLRRTRPGITFRGDPENRVMGEGWMPYLDDRREPLINKIARTYNVSPATISRLAGRSL